MLVGWGSFEASDNNKNSANTNKNLSSVEFGQEKGPDAWSILLANNSDLMNLKKYLDGANKEFEKAVNHATLVELIQNYKNALDDAASKDSEVKRCLDVYEKAVSKKTNHIYDILFHIIPYIEKLESTFFKQIIDEDFNSKYKITMIDSLLDDLSNIIGDHPQSFRVKKNIEESKNLTNAKNALDMALLNGKFENVIGLDKELDEYYNKLSSEIYSSPESTWMYCIPQGYRKDKQIIDNLAKFTRFDHLKSYGMVISYKKDIYEHLVTLEMTSRKILEAVADIQRQLKL